MDKLAEDAAAVNPVAMFKEAEADFREAQAEMLGALTRRLDARAGLSNLKRDLQDREAQFIGNGQVEGKNAEERKASLALLMQQDDLGQSFQKQSLRAQGQEDQAVIDTESATLRISSARARRNFALAVLGYLTAAPTELLSAEVEG